MSDLFYVESVDPNTSYPVGGQYRKYISTNTGFVQDFTLTDARSDIRASVFSYATSNPQPVALVDPTGAHLTVFSVAQGTTPWTVVGSTGVTQLSVWSAGVTQITSPWAVLQSSLAFTIPQGAVVGSVQASQVGNWTFTGSVGASQLGSWSVFLQGSDGTRAQVDSFASGGLLRVAVYSTAGGGGGGPATQVGCPWTFIGSVGVTQLGSWSVFVQGSDGTRAQVDSFGGGGVLRVAVYSTAGGGANVGASQIGCPWTFIGSVGATQVSSPWVTLPGSSGAIFNITGSVQATQQTSPWIVLAGSTGAVLTVIPTSAVGQLHLRQIASAVNSSLPYPWDGPTATVTSATANAYASLRLDSAITSFDVAGLLVVMASSGQALGQYRKVTNWTAGTSLYVDVESPWVTGALPASGQSYRLMMDGRGRTQALLRTECASNNSTFQIAFVLYDWGVNDVGSPHIPVPMYDVIQGVPNLARSYGVLTASYWQGGALTVNLDGCLGVKVDVMSAGGANFSLWGATT